MTEDRQTQDTASDVAPLDMAAALRGAYDYERPRRGQVVQAEILEIADREMMVDLGAKRDGLVPAGDLSHVDEGYLDQLAVGDLIPVAVGRTRATDGLYSASLSRGIEGSDWLRAEAHRESEEPATCQVEDWNKGGVVARFGRLRGFVPNSQLRRRPPTHPAAREQALDSLVGQPITAVVLEVNQRRRRLILSQRAADRQLRAELLNELSPGTTRTGTVVNLRHFGAFVDLGGVDGLIHVSELSHRFVHDPAEVLSLGDEVEVLILAVDPDRERISLSRKRLLPDPWVAGPACQAGDALLATVERVIAAGAVVKTEDGFCGLVSAEALRQAGLNLDETSIGSAIDLVVDGVDRHRRELRLRPRDWTDLDDSDQVPSAPSEPEPALESEAALAFKTG